MKDRNIELRDRAKAILALDDSFAQKELTTNFRRQIKLVNPNRPDANEQTVSGYSNLEIATLLIQAYKLLKDESSPRTMLEEDKLVALLIGKENIVPIKQTSDKEEDLMRRYNFASGWPEPSSGLREQRKYKFGGIC